jgi:hypothetical protein
MIRRILERITRNRPYKVIEVNGPYLRRVYMRTVLGYQIWLHHFLQADSERHLHTHPWSAISIMLCGWYIEETPSGLWHRWPWTAMRITPGRLHRIFDVEPGTWTLLIVGRRREPTWHFVDDGVYTAVETSPREWWK